VRMRLRPLVLLAILAVLPWRASGIEGPPSPQNGAALRLALEKLTVVGSVLYVAAHPDDENTAMLTWLENEKLVRTAYISLTRGDGGQNLIGDEQGDLLGVIRTQELLAARRIDGAEQFFTRSVDFGYSKTPEETLEKWGREEVLADVVRVLRTFQPDVIVMRFPTTGEGRHGHHTASALLAVEAFEAAADPSRFPDQLDRLEPWKARRVFWNYFSWAAPPGGDTAKDFIAIDLGAYNPLLGRSYTELAGESRSMHKSQGFGSAERRGTSMNYFKLIAGEPVVSDLLEGVDLSWNRIAGGGRVGELLDRVLLDYDAVRPSASLPGLVRARKALAELRATEAGRRHHVLLDHKAREIDEAIRSCAGLWLEAVATRPTFSPGDSIRIDFTTINRSGAAIRFAGVRTEFAGHASAAGATVAGLAARVDSALAENDPVTVSRKSIVPDDLDWRQTQPYWLREPVKGGMHTVSDPALIGTPGEDSPLAATFTLELAGETIEATIPVFYRWVDRVRGELYRPLAFAPAATLALDQQVYLFTDDAPRPVRLRIEARRAVSGAAYLELPSGWRSEPAERQLDLAPGDVREVVFQVTPGATGSPLRARFRAREAVYSRGMRVIDHPHIPVQTVFPDAAAHVLRLDLARVGERVGYIMGPGDEVPAALAQAGYKVRLLTDEDLRSGDLSDMDAIVVGVRAFNSREALKQASGRLLEYAEQGGTVVVQFNTSDHTLDQDFAPYGLKLGRDRVTVEEAPVTFVDPESPLLRTPNRITARDFDGWVQERGLYFASEWGPEYQAVLASADPGEEPVSGGLLWARHGRGIFIYTGYAFFRQLPAGVPGAYRLFMNLVSARG